MNCWGNVVFTNNIKDIIIKKDVALLPVSKLRLEIDEVVTIVDSLSELANLPTLLFLRSILWISLKTDSSFASVKVNYEGETLVVEAFSKPK